MHITESQNGNANGCVPHEGERSFAGNDGGKDKEVSKKRNVEPILQCPVGFWYS